MRRGTLRALGIGVLGGAGAGLAVAAVMTFLDWRLNPAGIFHDAGGTRWDIVLETAWTWFWPIALVAASALTVILFALRRS